jgi:hypothetical protein
MARAPEFLQAFFCSIFQTTLPRADFNRFFEKTMNREVENKNSIHSSAKQVVHPVPLCPIVAFWYDKISCCYWDQSTLEPFKVRTERVGILAIAVSGAL